MRLRESLARAIALGPRGTLDVALGRALRRARGVLGSRRDRKQGSHDIPAGSVSGPLARILPPLPREALAPHAAAVATLAALHLEHRFDLLGSGWVQVRHGLEARGLEGIRYETGAPVVPDRTGGWLDARLIPANRDEARRLWSLVGPGYQPVDWHVDFRSGYRWCERTPAWRVRPGHPRGADVKVPWELGRMQHLVTLATAHACAHAGLPGFREGRAYAREVRDQTLDFLAAAPPRFGVPWSSPMDVAIRIANLLLAFDLLRAHGHDDPELERELVRAAHEHAAHVAANLERTAEFAGNHYFSNLAGLVVAGAYLPPGREADGWLAFAGSELLAEMDRQFNPDGSNFEGSTAYHRLAAEMAVWSVAFLLAAARRGRPVPATTGSHLVRLGHMAEATSVMTGPGGRIVQFGDNDSGRFVRLTPVGSCATAAAARLGLAAREEAGDLAGEARVFLEDPLDHRHLVASVGALLERRDLEAVAPDTLERSLLRALGGRLEAVPGVPPAASPVVASARDAGVGSSPDFEAARAAVAAMPHRETYAFDLPGGGALEGLALERLPDFGLWVVRSRRLHLAIRCGAVGQRGRGGHDHNDQLAIELWVDGVARVRDPGTYLYLPLPERRDAYRSAAAHFVPQVRGAEPARLDRGAFYLANARPGTCSYFGPLGFAGSHAGYGAPVARVVELSADRLRVLDGSALPLVRKPAHVDPTAAARDLPYSPGYGLLERPAATPGHGRDALPGEEGLR